MLLKMSTRRLSNSIRCDQDRVSLSLCLQSACVSVKNIRMRLLMPPAPNTTGVVFGLGEKTTTFIVVIINEDEPDVRIVVGGSSQCGRVRIGR